MAKVHLRTAGNFLGEESRLYEQERRSLARFHCISELATQCRFMRIIGAINKVRLVNCKIARGVRRGIVVNKRQSGKERERA